MNRPLPRPPLFSSPAPPARSLHFALDMDPDKHIRPFTVSHRRRTRIITLAVVIGLVVVWFLWLMRSIPEPEAPPPPLDSVLAPTVAAPDTLPADSLRTPADTASVTLPIPAEVIDSASQAASTPTDSNSSRTPLPPAVAGRSGLLIPVAGMTADKLQDTYNDARSDGRVHDAIDIMAPRGTPVIAATDGEIVKLFKSERGGITLYQRSPTGDTIYYYAHLDGYADGIVEGRKLHRGELLGYVGETGNVVPGSPHLHFAIWLVTDPKKYWDGENINPYPLLK